MSQHAEVYGARIHYLEAGQRPVVVLIYGLGDEAGIWDASIGPLAEHYRVIVPDLIGHGRSDKPLLSYRVGTFVDFLHGLFRELKIERASLVGNSLGGWIAATFALAHPDQVERLVLIDSAGFSDLPAKMPVPVATLTASSLGQIRQVLPFAWHDPEGMGEEALNKAAEMVLKQRVLTGDGYTIAQVIDSYLRGEDVLDGRLGGVRQPTLIIWGASDRLAPLEFAYRFRDRIPGAQLEIIPNCGHAPQGECPAKFNTILLHFLRSAAR